MFENVGGKLQVLAKINMVIGIIASIVGGIVVWVESWELGFLYFLLIAVFGSLGAYISSLFLYAFGELVSNSSTLGDLVDNSSHIMEDVAFMRQNSEKPVQKEMPNRNAGKPATVKNEISCPKCGTRQPNDRPVCLWCGESLEKESTKGKENMKTAQTDSEKGILVTENDLVGEMSMICPVCKSKQLANRKICWQCGTKFIKETTE